MNKIHVRIYYEDTDAGGIVYHANYLKYFERGRSEWLRDLNLDQKKLLEENLAFVVRKLEIEYQKPAYFDDLLLIETKLIKQKKASLIFEQKIYNQNKIQIANATVLVASINLALKKPQAIPSNIKEVISSAS